MKQCTLICVFTRVSSSLLDPLTSSADASSKVIGGYIIPPEMTALTVSGQAQRATPSATDCIYCRYEVDGVTSYGTVTSSRKCPRSFVVASLDADHKYRCSVAPPLDSSQWPVMTPDNVDSRSSSSRTPSISAEDDLFLSLPYRNSNFCQRWLHDRHISRLSTLVTVTSFCLKKLPPPWWSIRC